MSKFKIEFDFGAGFDKHGQPLDDGVVIAFKQSLLRYASLQAGGCSLFPRTGAWVDNGQVIAERGYTLVVVTEDCTVAGSIATFIRTELNQSSVLVTVSNVESYLA